MENTEIQKTPLWERTLGELVKEDLKWASVFQKLGLDFCCGGSQKLEEVLSLKQIQWDEVKNLYQKLDAPPLIPRFDQWSLAFLCQYIVENHHKYLKQKIEDLTPLMEKIRQVHGARHQELQELEIKWKELVQDLETHLRKEEEELFPQISHLENTKDIEPLLEELREDHSHAGSILEALFELTKGYTPPEDSCNTFRYVYAQLKEVEEDLHIHIHLENNLLFPKVWSKANQKR